MRQRRQRQRRRRRGRLPFQKPRRPGIGKRDGGQRGGEGGSGSAQATLQSVVRLMRKSYGRHLRRRRGGDSAAPAGVAASKLQSPPLSAHLGRNRKTTKREKAPARRPTGLQHTLASRSCLGAVRSGTRL